MKDFFEIEQLLLFVFVLRRLHLHAVVLFDCALNRSIGYETTFGKACCGFEQADCPTRHYEIMYVSLGQTIGLAKRPERISNVMLEFE